MTELFLQTVNLSYRVSFLILVILLLRLVLKKAPKWIMVAMWGVAAVLQVEVENYRERAVPSDRQAEQRHVRLSMDWGKFRCSFI